MTAPEFHADTSCGASGDLCTAKIWLYVRFDVDAVFCQIGTDFSCLSQCYLGALLGLVFEGGYRGVIFWYVGERQNNSV